MDDKKLEAISRKIRIRRLILGYSQEYMAQELEISQNVYSKNERNIRNVPLARVLQICEILCISLAGLLEDTEAF
ncbi:helix-turn-helix domain-containing protein [Pedobacter sp.]|uniref:helix-turn-helix domain-containing protein n=1 Tax=Pedobacter sp. TaxID=1411316 RepID=UPI003BA92D21